MPIRIAFFLPHFETGGLERMVLNLLIHLDRRRFSPFLILKERSGALLKELPDDVEVADLGGRAMRGVALRLARCLTKWRFDAVYAGTRATNLALILASMIMLSRRPVVIVSEHTPPRRSLKYAKWRLFRILMMRLLYPRATRVVVPLMEVGEELRYLLQIHRFAITVLPNPVVDYDLFRQHASSPPADWPRTDGPVFISAGRLSREKGFDILLEAFAEYVGADDHAHLVILGGGPERERLGAMTRTLRLEKRVHFLGFVPNPWELFRHARALVMASRREGFGNVLVEAMACGTPVIASDCPVGPARILDGGDAGLLVPPEQPQALASAMRRLVGEPELARRLKKAGQQRAREFDVKHAVPAFEALLVELVDA